MLVIQVLMALLFSVTYFSIPSALLHYSLGTKDCVFVMVIAIDAVWVFHQVAVLDISPAISIADFWDVPGGMIDGTGYELAYLNGFWHDRIPFGWT